jgi:hypothetical protein
LRNGAYQTARFARVFANHFLTVFRETFGHNSAKSETRAEREFRMSPFPLLDAEKSPQSMKRS